MKVREVIEALAKQDPEAEVFTEGCDCDGDVGSIEVDPYKYGGNNVYLMRSER